MRRRNILVANNINLLPKGLIHSILDTVTMGLIRTELDGVSVKERCDTMLLSTVYPADIRLTPHELDYFNIYVHIHLQGPEGEDEDSQENLEHSRSLRAFCDHIPLNRMHWPME